MFNNISCLIKSNTFNIATHLNRIVCPLLLARDNLANMIPVITHCMRTPNTDYV